MVFELHKPVNKTKNATRLRFYVVKKQLKNHNYLYKLHAGSYLGGKGYSER